MKRLFAFSFLMATFVMNAVAWEPVIKERHWFGMHEFYSSPIIGHEDKTADAFGYNIFKYNNEANNGPAGWTLDAVSEENTTHYAAGHGLIGEYRVHNVIVQGNQIISEATQDVNHTPVMNNDNEYVDGFCIGLEARWKNTYVSYYKNTPELPAGTYALSYDVMNGNTQSSKETYENLFYVEVNETKTYDPRTEWMNGPTTWRAHTILFTLTAPSTVKVSLGFGMGSNNIPQDGSPALYVSRLKLERVSSPATEETHINWSENKIESIDVVKSSTGQGDNINGNWVSVPQRPKTTFYSWLDHKLRFSVDNPNKWYLGRNGKKDNVLGLMNMSGTSAQFTIHDLNAGDQFQIEYYRDAVEVTADGNLAPSLQSGSVKNLELNNTFRGTEYYEITEAGEITVNIPHNTLIRSVSIIHKNYQKGSVKVERMTPAEETTYGGIGYRCTMNSAGVLENKRGAVPYITMRFGAENDMTFIRDLGGGKFGASSVINKDNNFDPTVARLQLPYRSKTEEFLKDWLAEKEWSVFTADLTTNDKGETIEDFNSIYPLYGSYYYFFPEVNGKLIVDFYCEGSEESPALWYKQRANGTFPGVGDQPGVTKQTISGGELNGEYKSRTNNSNYYRFTIDVEKGGIYYLCSLPTNINHEHPIIRLTSYAFVPTFHVAPLYMVVDNGTTEVTHAENTAAAATIEGVTIDQFTGITVLSSEGEGDARQCTSGKLNNNLKITINGEEAPMVKFLGNVAGADVMLRKVDNDIKLEFENITYKTGTNINKGGAIVVNLDCPAGKATYVLTVAYKAADAKWGKVNNKDARVAANDGGEEVKRWDFYSDILSIGQYGTDDGTRYSTDADTWKQKSPLYKEVHKADGLTADWVKTYMNLKDNSEPIFKSVYDMEGDNADMLEETEGLIFITHSNQLGIYNENPVSDPGNFQDRYIGLMPGGQLIIPKLTAGDRVVIKMNRYGTSSTGATEARLTLENANDAIGNTITGNYIIGGSANLTKADGSPQGDQTQPHGEYHFISTGGDFKLTLTDGPLLKLYTIEIYRHAETIITENGVLGTNREILYTDKDNADKQTSIKLHYNGKGEPFAYLGTNKKTGTFKAVDVSFATSEGNSFTYTPSRKTGDNPNFGTFRPRLAVKTKDNAYVTDYADFSIAVGYRETKTYPYTWDFTDLKKYVAESGIDSDGNEVVESAPAIWNNFKLQVKDPECDGAMFVSGSQFYAGSTMFPETKGIGIHHYNNDVRRNDNLTINGDSNGENGGLVINDGHVATQANPLFWGFIVPEVAAKQAVYVHAKEVTENCQAKYTINEPMGVYSFDLEGTQENYIPAGWTCTFNPIYDGDVVVDDGIHTPGKDYSGGGARTFVMLKSYKGKALYWRDVNAQYGMQDGAKLTLKPGSYTLSFAMAAWKGTPSYKVAIRKYNGGDLVKESVSYTASPNANGDREADLFSTESKELIFSIEETGDYIICFSDETEGNDMHEFLLLQCDLTTPEHEFAYQGTDSNGEKIFAMSLPANAATSDVKLCFQGYEVNKIAVSDAPKKVNKYGWATESRNKVIDQELTSYFTGQPFETFIVEEVNVDKKNVVFTKLDDSKKVMKAATNGGPEAYIIHNTNGTDVKLLNDGFHLFVPDMHDYGEGQGEYKKTVQDMTNSKLKAQLEPGKVEAIDGDYTNFAFSYRYYDLNEQGYIIDDDAHYHEGNQSFYRIARNGVESGGNQGYLPILTTEVSNDWLNESPSRSFAVVFKDENDTDATTIETIQDNNNSSSKMIYNLNGQRMTSKPSRPGVYIVNGKKVLIK